MTFQTQCPFNDFNQLIPVIPVPVPVNHILMEVMLHSALQ